MRNKKSIALLIGLALITSIVFIGIKWKSGDQQVKDISYMRFPNNAGPNFRGFKYDKYIEGEKVLTIRAAHFSIEKKKAGIFKLSPLKFARLRGAEIDLFGETVQTDGRMVQSRPDSKFSRNSFPIQNEISFKGAISRDTIPSSILKGTVSAVFEPVEINLYLDDAPVTKIKAQKAIADPRRRRMILQNGIEVTSGASHLSTDSLNIYPETGLFEVDNFYVLKTLDGTRTGKNITTDFFLEKISRQ